jgi:ferrous iron transport protein A
LSTPSNTPTTPLPVKLAELAIGERARVVRYADHASDYTHQLTRLGLIPGVQFSVVRRAPLGDPVAIRFRGFSLAIRLAEADALELERT